TSLERSSYRHWQNQTSRDERFYFREATPCTVRLPRWPRSSAPSSLRRSRHWTRTTATCLSDGVTVRVTTDYRTHQGTMPLRLGAKSPEEWRTIASWSRRERATVERKSGHRGWLTPGSDDQRKGAGAIAGAIALSFLLLGGCVTDVEAPIGGQG